MEKVTSTQISQIEMITNLSNLLIFPKMIVINKQSELVSWENLPTIKIHPLKIITILYSKSFKKPNFNINSSNWKMYAINTKRSVLLRKIGWQRDTPCPIPSARTSSKERALLKIGWASRGRFDRTKLFLNRTKRMKRMKIFTQ
jgi:hypothetical protein